MAAPSLATRTLLSIFLVLAFVLTTPGFATKKPPVHPVNINSANSEELQQVPGIGPATADKILQMRKSYGPFKSVDDLLAIRGIGPKRLAKMRKYLTAGKSSSASPKKPAEQHPATCAACKKTPSPLKTVIASGEPKISSKKSAEPANADSDRSDEEPE
jgi:competence ComEA-like helix-hairpin-helix protein